MEKGDAAFVPGPLTFNPSVDAQVHVPIYCRVVVPNIHSSGGREKVCKVSWCRWECIGLVFLIRNIEQVELIFLVEELILFIRELVFRWLCRSICLEGVSAIIVGIEH